MKIGGGEVISIKENDDFYAPPAVSKKKRIYYCDIGTKVESRNLGLKYDFYFIKSCSTTPVGTLTDLCIPEPLTLTLIITTKCLTFTLT